MRHLRDWGSLLRNRTAMPIGQYMLSIIGADRDSWGLNPNATYIPPGLWNIPSGFFACKKRMTIISLMTSSSNLSAHSTRFVDELTRFLEHFSEQGIVVYLSDNPSYFMRDEPRAPTYFSRKAGAHTTTKYPCGCIRSLKVGQPESNCDLIRNVTSCLGKHGNKTFGEFFFDKYDKANHPNITVIDLADYVCNPVTNHCPVVWNEKIMYRDMDHMTFDHSVTIGPYLYEDVMGRYNALTNSSIGMDRTKWGVGPFP